MKHFVQEVTARRYDAARPYFHPMVVKRLARLLPAGTQIRSSLDVGCGTGHSTQALVPLSRFVVGLDVSDGMLRCARIHPAIVYVQGLAEQLPFAGEQFDLITAGLAFHWFDRITFLHEACRVLQPRAWLLIYNDYFVGRMRENASFHEWWQQYVSRFPAPPRNTDPLSTEAIAGTGFEEVGSEQFNHAEVYDLDQLTAYLMTQTNIIAVLQDNRETEMNVSAWLRRTLEPMFDGATGTFEYEGWMVLFRKVGSSITGGKARGDKRCEAKLLTFA